MDWKTIRGGLALIQKFGIISGVRSGVNQLRYTTDVSTSGVNVFDEQWDVLVVLDACRADTLREFSDEKTFLQDATFETRRSVATSTSHWISRTFSNQPSDERVAYVTANPHSTLFDETDLTEPAVLDEVWRYAWNDEIGTVEPRPVTDRAISVARAESLDRLIVHYLQPHAPFITHELGYDIGHFQIEATDDLGTWGLVQRGDIPPDDAIAGYEANLDVVLDDVAVLLDGIDAETVVLSADHGESLGEHGIYGHPPDTGLDCLQTVPWVTTTAVDTGEYEPDQYVVRDPDSSAEDRLNALGYTDR